MMTLRFRSAVRTTFLILLGVGLFGALCGAVCASLVSGDSHVMLGSESVDGVAAIGVLAFAGGLSAMVVAIVFAVLAGVIGVILPVVLIALLALAALFVGALALSAIGGVAVAFAPFLLVGFGCVLLFRAIGRRPSPVRGPTP